MRSGILRHKVTFQSKSITRDAIGGAVITWTDELTASAAAEPLYGREFFEAHQVHSEVSIRFTIRYRDGINTAWRILWEDRPYDVVEAIDVKGHHREIQLMAKTQQNG